MMGYEPSKANIINDTNAQTGKFVKVVALEDSVITLVSDFITENGSSTVSSINLNANCAIEGLVITSITLASGTVIAYEA